MRTLFCAMLCLVLSCALARAQEMRNMSILTGAKTGTYYRFGTDIADLLRKECGAEIAVKESQGSLANLQRLRHEANSQLAIVQQDSLDYLKKAAASDPSSRRSPAPYGWYPALLGGGPSRHDEGDRHQAAEGYRR
jgi:TRAP-type uncharacterized transport system substrate-binding protein